LLFWNAGYEATGPSQAECNVQNVKLVVTPHDFKLALGVLSCYGVLDGASELLWVRDAKQVGCVFFILEARCFGRIRGLRNIVKLIDFAN
jgi:hypothetical protein